MKNQENTNLIILEDDNIRLEQAVKLHKTEAEKMKQEFFDCGEKVINGSALFDQMEFDDWLKSVNRNHNP